MNERQAFITQIANAGADDTPRLVFADWLDEHAASDADHARAEYIRLSCAEGRNKVTGLKTRSGIKEGQWLEKNFHRLLPTLDRHSLGGLRLVGRSGSLLTLHWCYAEHSGRRSPTNKIGSKIQMHFWKGFAVDFSVSTMTNLFRCGGLIRQDEPFATPNVLEGLYSARQSESGETIAYDARANHLGPVYDLVTGHDQELPRDAFNFQSKLFNVSDKRDHDETTEAIEFSLRVALGQWVHKNIGRSYERSRKSPDLVPVVYPIDYQDFNRSQGYT